MCYATFDMIALYFVGRADFIKSRFETRRCLYFVHNGF